MIIVEQSCGKKMSKYIFYWVKKKRLVWVFLDIEEVRDKDYEIGLKKGGVIKIEIYSAFHIHNARSFALYLLTIEDVLRNHYQRIQIQTYKYLKQRKSSVVVIERE